MEHNLGGGFKYLLFSSLSGEMIQFDEYFSDGLKPPTSNSLQVWKTIIFTHLFTGPMAEPVKEDVHLQSCRGSTFVQILVGLVCSQSQIMGLPV